MARLKGQALFGTPAMNSLREFESMSESSILTPYNEKSTTIGDTFFMARAVGIEPTQMVLETIVLPLYEARMARYEYYYPIISNPAQGGADYLVSL